MPAHPMLYDPLNLITKEDIEYFKKLREPSTIKVSEIVQVGPNNINAKVEYAIPHEELEYRSNLSSKNAMDIKELQNKISGEINRILRVDDQFIGHRHVGYVHSDLPIEETPEPYTYEIKDHIVEDCGGWDDLFENSIDDLHKKYKLLMSGYNSLSKKERESEDGLKRWKKLNELSNRIVELDNNFQDFRKGDENFLDRFKKYFNSESLHHALVFGSIVFGLKMIEMNWSEITIFFNALPFYRLSAFLGYLSVVVIFLINANMNKRNNAV